MNECEHFFVNLSRRAQALGGTCRVSRRTRTIPTPPPAACAARLRWTDTQVSAKFFHASHSLLVVFAVVLIMAMPRATIAVPSVSGDSESTSAAAHTATYQRACELYEQAVVQLDTDAQRSESNFTESAALFRSLIESETGSPRAWDPGLLANAAHAALVSGDRGHAVLYYRRAAVLSPFDADVRRGLSKAQEQAGITDASRPMLERLASVMEMAPGWVRGVATLGAWGLFWLALAARTSRFRFNPPRWFVAACGTIAVLAAATFAPWELLRRYSEDAIVIASVTPRQGPDEVNYPAARTEPFKPGTPLRVIQKRGEWCCVNLNQTEQAWVEAGAVAKVFGVD